MGVCVSAGIEKKACFCERMQTGLGVSEKDISWPSATTTRQQLQRRVTIVIDEIRVGAIGEQRLY